MAFHPLSKCTQLYLHTFTQKLDFNGHIQGAPR